MIIKKYKKILFFLLYSTVFLFIIFCPFLNKAYALEVKYPAIPGNVDLNTTSEIQLPDYVRYLFDAGMFIGFFSVFISITIAGVMYLLSPANPSAELLSRARDRFSGAISGLLILVTIYLIITTINPQLSILTLNKLPPAPPPPQEKKQPGVYFYKDGGCSDNTAKPSQSSLASLGDLNNKVNSIGIVQDPDNGTRYIGVLYSNPNFNGQCIYINPNISCQPVPSSGTSASIYSYNFNSNGDGVYFFRKSNYNKKGGYYFISNSQIGKYYEANLEELKFQNVPEQEQDCVQYDKNGDCAKDGRRPPSLAGGNISSVYIHGNYLVLFVYVGSKDKSIYSNGPWSNCQEFPTNDDVNKTGPVQIKWQPIRNDKVGLPNALFIMPIQR